MSKNVFAQFCCRRFETTKSSQHNIHTLVPDICNRMKNLSTIQILLFIIILPASIAFSGANPKRKSTRAAKQRKPPTQNTAGADCPTNFLQVLQTSCHTPRDLLKNVGQHLTTENDAEGKVASLVLVRLAKMLIVMDNARFVESTSNSNPEDCRILEKNDDADCRMLEKNEVAVVTAICKVLAQSIQLQGRHQKSKIGSSAVIHIDGGIEGVKATAILSRILQRSSNNDALSDATLQQMINSCNAYDLKVMESQHLSGLQWAFDCFKLQSDGIQLSDSTIQGAYTELHLPFRVRPGFLTKYASIGAAADSKSLELTLDNIRAQVDFSREEIKTSTDKVVTERRETAWQGEDNIPGFSYSGKVMDTRSFSPVVRQVRDVLHQEMGSYYDCCLLNLYPDGDSGMRYHSDPEQGELWGFDTSVVSVGATRRFAFRGISSNVVGEGGNGGKRKSSQPHNFVVMDGDVTHMFGDCQFQFQHSVKTAEEKGERASRSSLVLKQCLNPMPMQQ